MATLERLRIRRCSEFDGAMMEKILKLPNCYKAEIDGSTEMLEKWEQMQSQAEYPIVVFSGGNQEEEESKRAIGGALFHGKCMEVKNGSDQLMERSSLLVGLEEGTRTTVALIMLPINMQSNQHQTLQQFVEKARETAKTNGWGRLEIVCARKVDLDAGRPTSTEERAEEEGIRKILLSLPKGSCAILSSEYKRVKVLQCCCDMYSYRLDKLSFFMANVGVDIEGRKSFENLKYTEEEEISVDVPSASEMGKSNNSIRNFIKSICEEGDGRSQCQSAVGERKTKAFIEALKESRIHYLVSHYNSNKVMVDDIQGRAIGFIICDFQFLGCIKLQQIYNDLQERDSNFIVIWVPIVWAKYCGYGSYTRLIQCMPWATFPYPQPVSDTYEGFFATKRDPRFVILDKDGQIANPDALPLLLGWGVRSYPFTQHTIPECFSLVAESDSCLELLLHGMNIVGRKPMGSKMTFLLAQHPSHWLMIDWLRMESMLKKLTRIHGSFEVLHVGRLGERDIYSLENAKQDYENAIQRIPWPSLSFSDMIMFWYRCKYLANEEAYQLNHDSNTMMETLQGFAKQLWHANIWYKLVLVDNGGVVTHDGEDVAQMICEPLDGAGMGMRMVKDELMKSLSSGECSPLVRTFFSDTIHNHPQHPQHPLTLCWSIFERCDICGARYRYDDSGPRMSYTCCTCDWDMCGNCRMVYAEQEVEQLWERIQKLSGL